MKAGFFQFRPVFGDIMKNLKKVVDTLDGVSADLIVLPELPFTGYYFKDRQEVKQLSQEITSSPIIDSLVKLCIDNDFYIVTGFAEKASDRYFNSAVLLGPEGVVHTYRKLHLFNLEKKWFDAGDSELSVQNIGGIKVGMMVCFDWIFPEVARSLSILGADIICHPSNLVLDYCQQTMISRSLENNIYTITANRFGADNRPQGSLRFTGKSQICAPRGKLIYRAHAQRETLFIADIRIDCARDKFITPENHILRDRRPEFYESICQH